MAANTAASSTVLARFISTSRSTPRDIEKDLLRLKHAARKDLVVESISELNCSVRVLELCKLHRSFAWLISARISASCSSPSAKGGRNSTKSKSVGVWNVMPLSSEYVGIICWQAWGCAEISGRGINIDINTRWMKSIIHRCMSVSEVPRSRIIIY